MGYYEMKIKAHIREGIMNVLQETPSLFEMVKASGNPYRTLEFQQQVIDEINKTTESVYNKIKSTLGDKINGLL